MTLVEFLLARIAEDEAAAREVMSPAPWSVAPDDFEKLIDGEGQWAASSIIGTITHIARHDPARVLAQCAAKRLIVDGALATGHTGPWDGCGDVCEWKVIDWTLAILAQPYADHPDYREEWKA